MQHRYPSFITVLVMIIFLMAAGTSQAQDQITVSGAGTTAVNGTYTYVGTMNSRPYYDFGTYRIGYRDIGYGLEWEIYNTFDDINYYYFTSNSATPPLTSGWLTDFAGTDPVPTVFNAIAFTGGTSYTGPHAASNSTNNPIGRFFLDAGVTGATLTALTMQFSGNISPITNVKLWRSADNTFSAVSDLQLNSKTAASSVTFNSFSSAIATTGTYYFVTADVSATGIGNVSASITNAAAFTISGGTITTSITSAALSSGNVTLPLQLLSFTAQTKEQSVIVNWTSAREENFSGYELERSVDGTQWNKLAFVPGNANITSTTKQYTFTDNNTVAGHSYYRLKMVDIDGSFTYSKLLSVKISNETKSVQSYPNPFSQSASIAFQLPVRSFTTLKVYNAMGVEVSTLMNKQLEAGNYTVAFDGASLPAGLYMYTLKYGKEVLSGTMLKK
jgi:hypothetical protein